MKALPVLLRALSFRPVYSAYCAHVIPHNPLDDEEDQVVFKDKFPWAVRQHTYSNNGQTKGFLSHFFILITFDAFQELNAVYNLNLEKDIGQAHLLQVRH